MNEIVKNYQQVQQRIAAVSIAAKRQAVPDLLAVSKRHSHEKVAALAAVGQVDFGESYAQEAVEKIKTLDDAAIVWHFIGPIQSNKCKMIAAHFDWVQSVDRMKILRLLSQHRGPGKKPLNVLLQVKIGDESSKSGASIAEVHAMAEATEQSEFLNFRGLMCIPPPSQHQPTQTAYFQEAKNVFDELVEVYPGLDTLSMGMSNDLEAAILTGSTMVRVGTDIFGVRSP